MKYEQQIANTKKLAKTAKERVDYYDLKINDVNAELETARDEGDFELVNYLKRELRSIEASRQVAYQAYKDLETLSWGIE